MIKPAPAAPANGATAPVTEREWGRETDPVLALEAAAVDEGVVVVEEGVLVVTDDERVVVALGVDASGMLGVVVATVHI